MEGRGGERREGRECRGRDGARAPEMTRGGRDGEGGRWMAGSAARARDDARGEGGQARGALDGWVCCARGPRVLMIASGPRALTKVC